MKTSFTEKLFEKQIDVKALSSIAGGTDSDTGTYSTMCSDNGSDTITYCYGEEGQLESTETTEVSSCS